MFSKFFNGQNEQTLAALEMQWRMEYSRAQRKFQHKNAAKKTKGRSLSGKLNLNLFNNGKSLDLSELARKVATTRVGQRAHKCAAKGVAESTESKPTKVIFYLLVLIVVISPPCFFLIKS